MLLRLPFLFLLPRLIIWLPLPKSSSLEPPLRFIIIRVSLLGGNDDNDDATVHVLAKFTSRNDGSKYGSVVTTTFP